MDISIKRAFLLLLLLPIVLVVGNTKICYANSPPPPTVAIVVPSAPEHLIMSIGSVYAKRINKPFESYFIFYLEFADAEYTLTVTEGSNVFEIALPHLEQYNNVFRLDLEKRELSPGTSSWRPWEFASITLALTLLIEGIIFFLFGYRKWKSWLIFLVTNIVTQGFLYVWLNNSFYPLVNSYSFPVYFNLVFGEFLVVIIEMFVLLLLINERRRMVTLSFVLLANVASLFAGGYLINALI
jgi:hypothetical protein